MKNILPLTGHGSKLNSAPGIIEHLQSWIISRTSLCTVKFPIPDVHPSVRVPELWRNCCSTRRMAPYFSASKTSSLTEWRLEHNIFLAWILITSFFSGRIKLLLTVMSNWTKSPYTFEGIFNTKPPKMPVRDYIWIWMQMRGLCDWRFDFADMDVAGLRPGCGMIIIYFGPTLSLKYNKVTIRCAKYR